MDFPNDVLFNINVAVVAMIFRKKYGFEFERYDDSKSIESFEMWEMTEKLHNILIECLGTDDAILDFINWFFNGIRKTFEKESDIASRSTSSRNTSLFSLQYPQQQQQILLFPDTCFQCKKPYPSSDRWCTSCESYIFESKFHTWTSGNVELDRLIKETQKDASDSNGFLRWVNFNDLTDIKQVGKGGFSEVYSAKYTKNRLDGTLKQWVANMECQIIMNYLQSTSEDYKKKDIDQISLENWDRVLMDFTEKMRKIYHKERKSLKCKPRDLSDDSEAKEVKRSNSLTKLKNLLTRRSSKKKSKKSKNKSMPSLKLKEPTKITQVPATTSPWNKFVPKTIILKRLVDSQNLSSSFIKEMKEHYLSLNSSTRSPRMYGLTQDPQTKDYYLVLQYANGFDLHKYLVHNCANISWWQRISILDGIVKGIYEIHNSDLIHHNLHTGNILVRHSTRRKDSEKINLKNTSPSVKIWISDSGIWGPAGSSSNGYSSSNNSTTLNGSTISNDGNSNRNSIVPSISAINRKGIYGVLPFVAPEVLQGKEYTKSSDIYSLGIIMWELSNSANLKRNQNYKLPFHDQPYDINLASEIINDEKRPKIDENSNIPDCWLDLMKKCWSQNPEDRPDINYIMKITNTWNMERRRSLNLIPNNLGSSSSLMYSLLNQNVDNNIFNMPNENITGQFSEAEKKRVERLNKGKQVDKPKVEGENKEKTFVEEPETISDEEEEIHSEDSMTSRLIDFFNNNHDENLEVIYEDSQEYNGGIVRRIKKEKVDSGYQQPREDQDYESLEGSEDLEKKEPEKITSEKENPNKFIEDLKKHLKVDDKQIGIKQSNQDSPVKNGIEANSETGSKEITISKEKE